MSARPQRIGVLALVASLCAWMLLVFADTAHRKQFWVDEGFEAVMVCERPASRMLLQGSYGCSPAPLFSMAQRLVIRSVEPLGLSMRVSYRVLSMGAATLALLVLLAGLQHRLGLAAALVAFATLAGDPGFHHYAEQGRAYITWVMSTAVLVIATAEMHVRDTMRLRTRLGLLLGAGLLIGMSATPGCGQAAMAFAAFWALQRWGRPAAPLGRKAMAALAVGAIAIVALDVHYWSGSICRGWGGADDMGLDFRASQDAWAMLANAASPLWGPGGGPWAWALRALLAAGVVGPVWLWRRRATAGQAQRYALALWAIALLQLVIVVPVALGLIASRYLFLPRMFIFALVPRAVLTAIGLCVVLELVRRRASRWAAGVAWAAGAAACVLGLWHAQRLSDVWRFPYPPVGDISCESLRASDLRLLRPADVPDDFRLNFLVRLGRALDSCPRAASAAGPPRYLMARDATNQADWFHVSDQPAPGFEPLVVCGQAITLRDGRFRWE